MRIDGRKEDTLDMLVAGWLGAGLEVNRLSDFTESPPGCQGYGGQIIGQVCMLDTLNLARLPDLCLSQPTVRLASS